MSAVTSSNTSVRPPKRRLSSDLFMSAATSFKPRPYTPTTTNVVAAPVAFPIPHASSSSRTRNLELHAISPAGMDPLPTDPNVTFIHPPFIIFPSSALYPDGLTYQLMAENPEWFLDPEDFVSQQNINPLAIPYPPHLEPPRGWCPAKRKDLKDRGAEGWPEGEEPRLRCTFCRRTYAGVNAKSMWRRHVFEKHKIAMSNRRDNNERPRGRGANKENSQVVAKNQLKAHDCIVDFDVPSQTELRDGFHKSKFRFGHSTTEDHRPNKNGKRPISKLASAAEIGKREGSTGSCHPSPNSHISTLTPPLTPDPLDSAHPVECDEDISTSSPSLISTVPPSPYDPLLTPSFRHSPPRLPSDQPWRYPSPSHPLHSRSREISLSMLLRDTTSPITNSSPVSGGSPLIQTTLKSSPRQPDQTNLKRIYLDFDTPDRADKSYRSSPHVLFSKGGSRKVLSGCIHDSPLRRSSKSSIKQSESESSDASELLPDSDPFATIYSPWCTINDDGQSEHPTFPVINSGAESPVVRNGVLPLSVGFGNHFTSLEGGPSNTASCKNFSENPSEESDEAEVASSLTISLEGNAIADLSVKTPPSKRRKVAHS